MIEILILRLIHVLGGVFWVGATLFTTFFLVPALATIGPSAGPVMAALRQRRLMTVLPVVALLTIASGVRLMWLTSAGFSEVYFHSALGHTLAAAGVSSMLAFLISLLIARPAMLRMGTLAGSMGSAPPDQRVGIAREMAALGRRNAIASRAATALLIISAGGMAIARYVH